MDLMTTNYSKLLKVILLSQPFHHLYINTKIIEKVSSDLKVSLILKRPLKNRCCLLIPVLVNVTSNPRMNHTSKKTIPTIIKTVSILNISLYFQNVIVL
jgi:hypothetical protein